MIVGSTSQSLYFRMPTGLAITSLLLSYVRCRDIVRCSDGESGDIGDTPLTELAEVDSDFSADHAIEVAFGLYRVDVPNAAFAAGVSSVVVNIRLTGDTEYLASKEVMLESAAPAVNVTQWGGFPIQYTSVPGGYAWPMVDSTAIAQLLGVTAAPITDQITSAKEDIQAKLGSSSSTIEEVVDGAREALLTKLGSSSSTIEEILDALPESVLAQTVDGVAVGVLLECLLAVAMAVTGVEDDTITFMKRDGATGRLRVTVGTGGQRTVSEIL